MILADTHVLVWLATGDHRLPDAFREQIAQGTALATSAVVAFEYCELHARGRLGRGLPFHQIVDSLNMRIEPFPSDAWRVLPDLPLIHRDPADRMLIAHTLAVDGVLATADENMRRYPVSFAW